MYTGSLQAVSNREDWQFSIVLTNPDSDDLVDLTGATITVAVRLIENKSIALNGTNTDGHITVTGPGAANVLFGRAEMAGLAPSSYDVGITLRLATGLTYQLFSGTLPVVDGVVD